MTGQGSVVLSLLVLTAIALAAVFAPVYARHIGATPFESHVRGEVMRNGRPMPVLQPNENSLQLGYTPVGPDWRIGAYALGADAQGRDVSARLLYGTRSSLLVAGGAAALCLVLATILSLCAGFVGGWVERVVTWVMTMLWAVPVYLFASCLSMTMLRDGLHLGPWTVQSNNRAIPVVVIAFVYLPYATRILSARVQQLVRKPYVEIARGFGASSFQVIMQDILTGLITTIAGFLPLLAALCLLAESALSFLSLGVQAPDVSLGTMIHDGEGLIHARPLVAILPGIIIILSVMSLYILSERGAHILGGRDAP